MACEFFEENRMTRCRAVQGTLIPSHHEREQYCRTAEPSRCPTLKLYQLRREPLPQEAYYGLWVPFAESPASRSRAASATGSSSSLPALV